MQYYYTYLINCNTITRAGAGTRDKIFKYVGPEDLANIKIVAFYDNFNDAMKHAVSTGFELLPTSAVVCNETGEYFINAAHAAKDIQTTVSIMSRHLNKKPWYNTIKGRTFRYVNKV